MAATPLLAPPAQAERGSDARAAATAKAAKAAKAAKSKKPRTVDKAWSGFTIPDDGRASGRFLGARRLGSMIVYRIDPGAKQGVAKGFATPVYADVLTGSGKRTVSALDTQRAAYLLGKYGAYRLKVQNAAVELALDELLVGGKYALKGSQTAKRLAPLPKGQRKRVVGFAKAMLASSAQFASTYAVSMTSSPGVALGETVSATVTVVNRTNGSGIANLPVSFAYPGAAPQTLRTDAAGRATASFTAGAAGPQLVSANVANVPETRLVVLNPTTRKASRLVVADVKTASSVTSLTAVQARPVLSMVRSFGGIAAPYTTAGQKFSLAGTYPGARTAQAVLWGPYASDTAATCTGAGKVSGRGTVAVRDDGAYTLPKLTLPAAGFYRWQVSLPADAYNLAPATICAGVMRRAQ